MDRSFRDDSDIQPGSGCRTYEVTLERGVKAKMRDGVILRADIYRPKADGQFPVLLAAHAL